MHEGTCAHGHPQRGPADYFEDGQCRRCDRARQSRYRTRRRAAVELAQALESYGVQVMRSDPPVDLQQLAAALAGGYEIDTA